MSKTILIIEDDASIAEVERDFLEINGFAVDLAADGETGLQKAMDGSYDLILLDLMLPGVDGLTIMKRLRGVMDIPILMVTAKIEDIDKIRGLGLGADDYVTKPFSPTELVARVKANLAQYERLRGSGTDSGGTKRSPVAILEAGPVRIDERGHRVFIREQEVELTNREFELLLFLVRNPEIVFSKDALYEQIWGPDAYGDLKTVTVHINRLREKIEQDSSRPVHIQTVWGAGYKFMP